MNSEKLIVFGLLSLVLTACGSHDTKHTEQKALRVQTMVVLPQNGSTTSRYVGSIRSVRETPMSFQSAGRVVKIAVQNGERVKKGQVIATIDDTQAQNMLRAGAATYKHAQDGFVRARQLHEKGVITDQKMVEIESQLAQAKSAYSAAKQQVDECTLTAPYDGIVSGLSLEMGQTVIPGTQVCTVLDMSAFCVLFTVPEAEINGLVVSGERLAGTVECAAVDTVLPIRIVEKNLAANVLTHTYDVKATIQGGADILVPGMVAIVKVNGKPSAVSDQSSDIIIPAKCILMKPEGATVWVVEQGRAVRRAVTIDGYQASGVRISEGLHAGDSLIIEGYQKLYMGCKVKV